MGITIITSTNEKQSNANSKYRELCVFILLVMSSLVYFVKIGVFGCNSTHYLSLGIRI